MYQNVGSHEDESALEFIGLQRLKKATEDYVQEHQKIISAAPRRSVSHSAQRAPASRSLITVVARYLRGVIKAPLGTLQMLSVPDNTRNLFRNRAAAHGRTCLVVANGPSAGFLDGLDLEDFTSRGGDVFAVNHFSEIEAFRKSSPTHYFSSDPNTPFQEKFRKTEKALSSAPSSIKIFVPMPDRPAWKRRFPNHEVTGFCDRERLVSFFGGRRMLSPFLPRPYKSMTAHKALAYAIWAGYSKIYIIGFDNTYVRDLYVSPDRTLLLRDRHAGSEEKVLDITHLYPDSGAYLEEAAEVVSDTRLLSHSSVLNLDPFSIVSAFAKVGSIREVSQILRGESEAHSGPSETDGSCGEA